MMSGSSLNESFLLAVKNGDYKVWKLLRNSALDINYQDQEGNCGLMIAAANNELYILQKLLQQQRIMVNLRNMAGKTALQIALDHNNYDIVCSLLKIANIEYSAVDFISPIAAILYPTNDLLANLLQTTPDVINNTDRFQNTPLIWASSLGMVEKVKILINSKNIDPNSKGRKGTAMTLACALGYDLILQELLRHPQIDVNARDYNYNSPFSYSIMKNHMNCVELLLGHPCLDLNGMVSMGRTPLTLAISNPETTEIAIRLLKVPGIDVHVCDLGGKSPLHLAAIRNARLVTELCKFPGVDVNQLDFNKNSPIQLAVGTGNVEIVRALRYVPGINVNTTQSLNLPAIIQAVDNEHVQMVKELLLFPDLDLNCVSGYSQKTPLMISVTHDWDEIFLSILNDYRTNVRKTNPKKNISALKIAEDNDLENRINAIQEYYIRDKAANIVFVTSRNLIFLKLAWEIKALVLSFIILELYNLEDSLAVQRFLLDRSKIGTLHLEHQFSHLLLSHFCKSY